MGLTFHLEKPPFHNDRITSHILSRYVHEHGIQLDWRLQTVLSEVYSKSLQRGYYHSGRSSQVQISRRMEPTDFYSTFDRSSAIIISTASSTNFMALIKARTPIKLPLSANSSLEFSPDYDASSSFIQYCRLIPYPPGFNLKMLSSFRRK